MVWVLLPLPLLHFLIVLVSLFCFVHAQPPVYPSSANLSTTWVNDPSNQVTYSDSSSFRIILLRKGNGPSFACGFFCNRTVTSDSFLFVTSIVQTIAGSELEVFRNIPPRIVWSGNREHPVREDATLQLTQDGDLVLRDSDGTFVWSTNTSDQSVTAMNLTETGNLVLLNSSDGVVWQSFDHPVDTLLLGQRLVEGQRLTASNWTQGLFYLTISSGGLFAYVNSNPPQMYYRNLISNGGDKQSYVRFVNGSLGFFRPSKGLVYEMEVPHASSSVQYMKLESDGHLRVHDWNMGWKEVVDLFDIYLDNCHSPTFCGNYGICSNGQCSCPTGPGEDARYFKQLNVMQPNLGCYEINPVSCQTREDNNHLLDIGDISYFYYIDDDAVAVTGGADLESCKQACMKNCSCKAALFQYQYNVSYGKCFLPSQIFSLMDNRGSNYKSAAFIKVQVLPTTSTKRSTLVTITSGSIFGALVMVFIVILLYLKLSGKKLWKEGEDYIEEVEGMPMRFSYEELKVATLNFTKMIGKGGFGCVFEGVLVNGTKVAVKRLESINQGMKEFLNEVRTIGSIHHVNLVRLIGFCAEKSHRLLVYEYMSNGSLDNWIFYRDNRPGLYWITRKKIILDIAKGLSYLHEECRQRIAHLDIKPQNILLDDNFDSKVSDFGLSKFIDRDQSQVVTTMRGTHGYLAPEWLVMKITEKVDVYSFGIMVLEIVCGRKNLDYSLPEESAYLLQLLQSKAEEDELLDIVDRRCDMRRHGKEAVKMLKIAVWCIQYDFNRRPSMSKVVKVLEGLMDMETCLDYNFFTTAATEVGLAVSAAPLASILSGPR